MTRLIDDCFFTDRVRLSHEEALSHLNDRVPVVTATERVPIAIASGRILAESITAAIPVPAHSNAAVDGYAFAIGDLQRSADGLFPISGRATAGHPLRDRPPAGSAVRIFTGAMMPEGCDTVVMQEDVQTVSRSDGDVVHVPRTIKAGANRRSAGEDVKAGQLLFNPGHRLRPQDVAALASIGCGSVQCFKPLKVAILSTGDEIVAAGAGNLAAGQVYDANGPMLAALASGMGASVTQLGVIADDLPALKLALGDAAREHDLILTSGGASQGDEDHMAAAVHALGRRHFWQIAVKPGRPMMFGQIGNAALVGLPGNPVAVFVCFLMYVRPLMNRLAGAAHREPRRFRLRAQFTFRGRKTGRREFWRGLLVSTPEGLGVEKFERDGSGLISSLRAADGLIDVPEDRGDIQPGDLVDFIPFAEFGIAS